MRSAQRTSIDSAFLLSQLGVLAGALGVDRVEQLLRQLGDLAPAASRFARVSVALDSGRLSVLAPWTDRDLAASLPRVHQSGVRSVGGRQRRDSAGERADCYVELDGSEEISVLAGGPCPRAHDLARVGAEASARTVAALAEGAEILAPGDDSFGLGYATDGERGRWTMICGADMSSNRARDRLVQRVAAAAAALGVGSSIEPLARLADRAAALPGIASIGASTAGDDIELRVTLRHVRFEDLISIAVGVAGEGSGDAIGRWLGALSGAFVTAVASSVELTFTGHGAQVRAQVDVVDGEATEG